jgi:hypothetical protein
MGVQATVKDHLTTIDNMPEWVISLARMIQSILDSSSAIASARAKDLSRLPSVGEALESIVRGWEILNTSDLQTLSPLQRETIEKVVSRILRDVQNNFETTRRMES